LVRLSAVIVTTNPDIDQFGRSIRSIKDQADSVVIVDNASRNVDEIKRFAGPNVRIICNDHNYGLGQGLNTGAELLKDSADWILTLDPDSIVLTDIKKEICGVLDTQEKIGIVALSNDDVKDSPVSFTEKVSPMTNGCVIRSDVFKKGIRYREELFVDQVDFDFDYEVRKAGFKIVALTKRSIAAPVGRTVKNKRGREIAVEPLWRIYLISRNSFKLLAEGKISLRFGAYQVVFWNNAFVKAYGVKVVTKVILVFLIGMIDAISNNFGPPPRRWVRILGWTPA